MKLVTITVIQHLVKIHDNNASKVDLFKYGEHVVKVTPWIIISAIKNQNIVHVSTHIIYILHML